MLHLAALVKKWKVIELVGRNGHKQNCDSSGSNNRKADVVAIAINNDKNKSKTDEEWIKLSFLLLDYIFYDSTI